MPRQPIIVGCYMIVFGLVIGLLGTFWAASEFSIMSNKLQSSRFLPRCRDTPLSSSPSSAVVSVSRALLKACHIDVCSHSLVYIFLGSLLLGKLLISKIAGGIVGTTGIAYVALEFLPSIEPPSNMREAEDAGWGAEQV